MLESTILIVIALIAIAVAAIFINRYLSLKEKAGTANGQSTVDVNLIEQAALAKSLQEQVEQLTDELNSLEHTSTVNKEQFNKDKLTLTTDLANSQSECTNLKDKLAERESYIAKLQQDHVAALEKEHNTSTERYEKTLQEIKSSHAKMLESQESTYKENIAKLEQALSETKCHLEQATKDLQEAVVLQAQYKSEKEALEQLRISDQQRFEQAQQELEHRLNTMSEKLLKDRSESLQKLNNENMVQIINPLQQELNTFRELISSTQKNNSEQAGQLQNELKHLHEAQVTLGMQAQTLSQALLQGSKSQGIWGEQQLELVLDAAGLTKDDSYVRECYAINEQGDKGRADVLVRLPHNQGIIIDSKCSLTAYTELNNAQNEHDKKGYEDALKRHLDSIKKHVDELSKKNYPGFESYGSPNFVFMFVPIDHALGLALRSDDTLYSYAQNKNIYLISPSSLLPALRIVGNLWALANQGDKFKLLANSADRIYKKCNKVCNDFENILKIRDNLNKNIDAMAVSLCKGQGNLQTILQKFALDAPALSAEAAARFESEINFDPSLMFSNNHYQVIEDKVEIPKAKCQLTATSNSNSKSSELAASQDTSVEATIEAPQLTSAAYASTDASDAQTKSQA